VLALAAVLPLITLAAIAVAVKAAAARSRPGLVMSKSPDFDVSCGNRLIHAPPTKAHAAPLLFPAASNNGGWLVR